MRAKTIADLISLSANLYLLSKDDDFLKEIQELKEEGRKKAGDLYASVFSGDDESHEEFVDELRERAAHLKQRFDVMIDTAAAAVYERMHIAHTDEIKKLSDEIAALRTELALMEAKVVNLQQSNEHGTDRVS